MAYTLPELGYDFAALEPHIDAQTMQLHHDKHHATYVEKLNAALTNHKELADKDVVSLLQDFASVPEEIKTAVRNHGGGHANHTLFWEIMAPGGATAPSGELLAAVEKLSGDLATFKQQFNEKALSVFGSGWTWLIKGKDGALEIVTTPNQDNPLMDGKTPLMGLDVWEHAYYLKYQNKRPDYVAAWWNVLNWDVVAANFSA